MNMANNWNKCAATSVILAGITSCQLPSATLAPLGTDPRSASLAGLSTGAAGSIFWTAAYSERVDIDESGHSLVLYGGEQNPASASNETLVPAPYETWEKTFPLTFAPTAAAFRTGNELYVAGRLANGDTIIERWDFPHVLGAYYSSRTSVSSTNPFGTPVTTGPLAVGIEGSTYMVPSSRVAPTPTVTAVFSGTSLGRIAALGVDPDRRFLFVIDDASGGRLVQLRLTAPPTIVPIATEIQYPGLINSGSPRPIDQSQVGRLYYMQVNDAILWVEDPTNDAILGQASLLDFRSFYLAFPELTWTMVYP